MWGAAYLLCLFTLANVVYDYREPIKKWFNIHD